VWPGLEALAELRPGWFALVMATGIISGAAHELGLAILSDAFLAAAAIAYAVLCVLTAVRIVAHPRSMAADLDRHDHVFGMLAFVAASGVLGARLLAAGAAGRGVGLALTIAGALAWAVLVYMIPARLVTRTAGSVALDAADGSWLMWVVATQSVAVSAATIAALRPRLAVALGFVAATLWGFGIVLYLVLTGILTLQLLLARAPAGGLTPPYWIIMGATAISTLAAARIALVPGPGPLPPEFVAGLGFVLWAFGTWWIPLLAVLGLRRRLRVRALPAYHPSWWSLVFPLGMYAAASEALGQARQIPELIVVAHVEIWIAVAAWALTALALLMAASDRLRRNRRSTP
jgi:tellurite resistance protein TehA-like permease